MKLCILSCLLLILNSLLGQTTATFIAQSQACRNENIILTNNSVNANRYEWDFCAGDLGMADLVVNERIEGNLAVPVGTSLINHQGNWYGFVTNLSSNSITRLAFGSSLENNFPLITNLGNLGGFLSSPQDIKAVSENGNVYLFVSNRNSNKFIRINLGNDINNATPTTDILLTGNADVANNGIEVKFDGQNWIAFYTSQFEVVMLKLGTSLHMLPASAADIISTGYITGVDVIGDFTVERHLGVWYGFVVGVNSKSLHRLDFGPQLFSAPASVNITPMEMTSYTPQSVVFKSEGASNHLFISSSSGDLLRLDFLDTPVDNYQFNDLGKFQRLANTLKLDIINDGSIWKGLSANWSAEKIYLIDFPNPCNLSTNTSILEEPIISYPEAGNFKISLTAYGDDFSTASSEAEITILTSESSPVAIDAPTHFCAESPINISPISQGSVSSYEWDLGDGDQTTVPDPNHSYTAGAFDVKLQVVFANGCQNMARKSIKVYDAPVPSFDIPTSPICTNNEFTFNNNTVDNYDGHLTYQWFVGDNPISTERDLQHTFTTTGDHSIKLVTSIPGCSSEVEQILPSVESGPVVDFSVVGRCEEENVEFQNLITDEVSSMTWYIESVEESNDPMLEYSFADAGTYDVTLSALSLNGCDNSKTHSITIYSKPQPDFNLLGSPNACSGSETSFINSTPELTDSYILTYQWNFGDPDGNTSSLPEPVTVYQDPGEYLVSLSTTTDQGCTNTIHKPITIEVSPSVTLTNSATCVGVPSMFEAAGSSIQSHYWEIGTAYYETPNPTHTFPLSGNYNVMLIVTGENGCMNTYQQTVTVPPSLQPNFNFVRNCVGYETSFVSTTVGADPIQSYEWQSGNDVFGNESSAQWVFNTIGQKPITLKLVTESGCKYQTVRNVPVVPAPVAQFSASTYSGAAPLEVEFTNETQHATEFFWSYGDGFTSEEISPDYTYNELGEFLVELVALNSQGCESSVEDIIKVEQPRPDVDIKLLNFLDNPNGTLKVVITLENKGNTVIRDLPVEIDISGNVKLTETIKEVIKPSSLYNLVLDYGIHPANGVHYLCAETLLENDLNTADDRVCKEFENESVILSPYPNPARDLVNVEWIAPLGVEMKFSIEDLFGKNVFTNTVNSIDGLNRQVIDVKDLRPGIYFLRLEGGAISRTVKILVSASK